MADGDRMPLLRLPRWQHYGKSACVWHRHMSSPLTVSLQKPHDGNRNALDDLMPLVYEEVRRIARLLIRHQRPNHTLQATALVHEAFIKLYDDEPRLVDRGHLVALMSRVMRQVLTDHARARCAAKRGGGNHPVIWDGDVETISKGGPRRDLLALRGALDALALANPYLAKVVELYYFAGMTAREVAAALDRSAHAVRNR